MAEELQDVIRRLLVPENAVIQEATQQLKELFRDKAVVPLLCQVLGSSQNAQVRQYSAVLFRRKIQRKHQWRQLSEEVRQNIRENIIQLFLQETEMTVKNSIAQVIATIGKHELPCNGWPHLFNFLVNYVQSHNPMEREAGLFILRRLASVATEQLKPHLDAVFQLLSETLKEGESLVVLFYSIMTLSELVMIIGDDEMKCIQKMIPVVIDIIQKRMLEDNQDWACECMEVFDGLLECEVAIVVPHLKSLVGLCLSIMQKRNLQDLVRVKAMSLIKTLTSLKKKAVLKKNVTNELIHILFEEMCAETEDLDEASDEEDESEVPSSYAAQVIDTLALHLPPEKVIPNLLVLVEKALQSEEKFRRKAAYTALAMVAEGCSDYVVNNHLNPLVDCVCRGMEDGEVCVRNAAFFALGQFAEYLQPEISKLAPNILPLLFRTLLQTLQDNSENASGLTKSYYALERICENLGDAILPFLPSVMDHLLLVVKAAGSLRTKEVAISVIGAAANAAGEGMQPYFHTLITHLNEILLLTDDKYLSIQIQAIDTLAVLARKSTSAEFLPIADNCMQMGLNLIDTKDDPDLRRCVYGLFASVTALLKEEMGKYLSTVMNHILDSVRSDEGVQVQFKEDMEEAVLCVFSMDDIMSAEEEDLGEEEENDEEKVDFIQVENSYVDEKADACSVLGDLAVNIGLTYMPYLEESYKEVMQLMEYPIAKVRKSAVVTLGQFCQSLCDIYGETKLPEVQTALTNLLDSFLPSLLDLIKQDADRLTVMAAVDVVVSLLNKVGQAILCKDGMMDVILTITRELFSHKTACQDANDDEGDNDDDQDAEYDAMLIESAGELLPAVARVVGGEVFMPYFKAFIPDFIKRLKGTSTVADRSFSIGAMAETLQACGKSSMELVNQLYPVFMKMINDPDEEMEKHCQNSVDFLTVLQREYPRIFNVLFSLLQQETHDLVRDNICAAACRMIEASHDNIPLEQILPIVIQCLPLKQDFEENATVFTSLLGLFSNGNVQLIKLLPNLLKVVVEVLGTQQINKDTEDMLVHFMRNVHSAHPDDLAKVKVLLSSELSAKLNRYLSVS